MQNLESLGVIRKFNVCQDSERNREREKRERGIKLYRATFTDYM